MSLPVFPALPGIIWPVKKTPVFNTLIQSHRAGGEARAPLNARALWRFELSHEALDGNGHWVNLSARSLQALMGLWLSVNGPHATFVYVDPDDNTATNQQIGVGDGATTTFVFGRPFGAYYEPVSYVTGVTQVNVAGVPTSAYIASAPNVLTFTSAPSAGAAVTATFTYAFQCRFSDDQAQFVNFMSGLWSQDKLTFESVR